MTKKMKIISGGILVAAVVAGYVWKTKDKSTCDEDTEMTETVAKPVGPAFNPDLLLPLRRSNAISDQG